MGKKVVCPKCNYPQYCPCENCQKSERHGTPEGFKPWKWIHGEAIECAGCGFTMHADGWLEEEYRQFGDLLT